MEADGHLQGICMQRLSANGLLLGRESVVNQTTPYNQSQPAIAALAGGGFVVAWVSEAVRGTDPNVAETLSDTYAVDIYARRFDAAGNALGGEFKVNTQPYYCNHPSVAAGSDGGFTVVWDQRDAVVRTNSLDILARTYDAAGLPLASAAVVNATTYGDQYEPRIAAQGSQYLVVWTSLGQDGSYEGVYGQIGRAHV